MPNIDTIKNTSMPDLEKKLPLGVRFMDPAKIVDTLGIDEGMKIADFGCGTGYFAFPLAKKVGRKGLVYALDILNPKLEAVNSQAKLSGITNIITMKANLELSEGSGLKKESVDWVILVNMLFQNNREGRKKIINEAKRVLVKGGRALVVEWNESDISIGPDKDFRISKEDLTVMIHEYGLGVLKEIEIGNFHYGLILGK